jgi:hypothetical protein
MPWERCSWISACSRFPNVKWYEGTPNGAIKARPIPDSNNDSSQNTC